MIFPLRVALLINLLYVNQFSGAQTLDLGFIKEEPYKKSKQAIDASSILTPHEARVIKDAITPIMRLLVGITFATLPPAVEEELVTKHGRGALRMPPFATKRRDTQFRRSANGEFAAIIYYLFQLLMPISLARINGKNISFLKKPTGCGVLKIMESFAMIANRCAFFGIILLGILRVTDASAEKLSAVSYVAEKNGVRLLLNGISHGPSMDAPSTKTREHFAESKVVIVEADMTDPARANRTVRDLRAC
ncbi:MAG: hypothetical protein QM788_10250 [Roseateles sp.]|uniref:hypothetical protein n=1 Tax=Roseateles sp. TaxID=1971397 RepID=UPI0039ED7178